MSMDSVGKLICMDCEKPVNEHGAGQFALVVCFNESLFVRCCYAAVAISRLSRYHHREVWH